VSEGFLRPETEVLGDEALIPAENLVRPPPNHFTHELVAETPFFYRTASAAEGPDGRFEAGTKVVLLVRGAEGRCRVVDDRGVYAEIACESLVELSS
jgi:hypothetical protein